MTQKIMFTSYWKSIALTTCILYLSFAPSSTFNELPTFKFEDKIIHLLMYLALTISLLLEYNNNKIQKTNVLPLIAICAIFPIFLGGLIEVFQPILSATRTASWFDWGFNILGVTGGWMAFYLYYRILTNRK